MAQADVKQSIVTVSIAHHTKTGDLVWSIFFSKFPDKLTYINFTHNFLTKDISDSSSHVRK